MPSIGKFILEAIDALSSREDQCDRLLISSVPDFIQQEVYLSLKTMSIVEDTAYVLTSANGVSSANIHVVNRKEDILSLRNNYGVKKIIIFSDIPLDRSNVSTLIDVSSLSGGKWLWVKSDFGKRLLELLVTDIIDSVDVLKTVQSLLEQVGRKYVDGHVVQWKFVSRLATAREYSGVNPVELVGFLLGLPRISGQKLEDAISIMDSKIFISRRSGNNSIDMILSKLGLLGFRDHVLKFIDSLGTGEDDHIQQVLGSELSEVGIELGNGVDMASVYSKAFSDLFIDLKERSIEVNEIRQSVLSYFFCPNIYNRIVPGYWQVLTTYFWHVALSEFGGKEKTISVRLVDKLPALVNKVQDVQVIYNSNRKIRLEIENWERHSDLQAIIGENSTQISEGRFDYEYTSEVQPISISIKSSAGKKIVKALNLADYTAGLVVLVRDGGSSVAPVYDSDRDIWTSTIDLTSPGRCTLQVLCGPQTKLIGLSDMEKGEDYELRLDSELESLEVDLYVSRIWIDFEETERRLILDASIGDKQLVHEIVFSIQQKQFEKVNSYFQKAVKEHLLGRPITPVTISIRDVFIDQFEDWIIRNAQTSCNPICIGVRNIEQTEFIRINRNEPIDFGYKLARFCGFPGEGPIEFPDKLIDIRKRIIDKICFEGSVKKNEPLLIRQVDLTRIGGTFESLLEDYLFEFLNALQKSRNLAIWFDIHAIVNDRTKSSDLITSKDITGLLVSPYHPLRLYWQFRAQTMLLESKNNDEEWCKYCPAASALDPSIVPDVINMQLKSNTGMFYYAPYVSLTNNSDYWGILLNPSVAMFPNSDKFWAVLGFKVEEINQGLFSSQIERSLRDVSRIMASKDKLRVTIQGESSGYEEDGILSWLKSVNDSESLDDADRRNYLEDIAWSTLRKKKLEVYDMRPQQMQPEEYALYEHFSSLGKNISWYDFSSGQKTTLTDLSIICNVGVSELSIESAEIPDSPSIGPLMYKQRLIKVINDQHQIPMQEQRSTLSSGTYIRQTDRTFDAVLQILESYGEESKTCIAVTARVDLLQQAIRNSHLSVVSSSVLTPATFSLLSKTSKDEELYLWDFDLPSFNNTSNTKNGYFLLAHPKAGKHASAIRRSLESYLTIFKSYRELEPDKQRELVRELLLEYIAKGLPSLKKLVYGGNAFRGEVGNLVALRILQGVDMFSGIIPIIQDLADSKVLSIVVPIDPFREVIERIPREEGDDKSRPDFLIFAYRKWEEDYAIKITPLEVKFRTGTDQDWRRHLDQATKFIGFLRRISKLANKYEIWRIAEVSILGRMLEYGLHISSSMIADRSILHEVYSLGYELIQRVFSGSYGEKVQLPTIGKLIYINADSEASGESCADKDSVYVNWMLCQDLLFRRDEIAHIVRDKLFPEDNWMLVPESTYVRLDYPSLPEGNSESEEEELSDIENQSTTYDEYLKLFPKGVDVPVGKLKNSIGTKELFYNPGSTEVNQLNIGVIGDLGTGKTQLLKNLVYQLSTSSDANRGGSPKFLILDTKRDYDGSVGTLDMKFIEKIDAKIVQPIGIPLNIFDIKYSDEINAPLNRARFFIDVLNRIYGGIGPVQKDTLLNAIVEAYNLRGYSNRIDFDRENFESPTLLDVRDIYQTKVKQVDAPLAIMNALILEGLFETDSKKTTSFTSFFDRSVVVSLGDIASSLDSLKLVMVVFLKLYQEYMMSVKKEPYVGSSPSLRKIDSFVLVDEAKLVMDYGFQVLEDLLRKGREFGVGVILSSQYLSDFSNGKIDYKQPLSTWFIHKVPDISVKEIKSVGIVNADEGLVSRIKSLDKHYCVYKTVGVDGMIMRGTPLYEVLSS
ncbi:MAG: hypothetical protein WBP58_01040 [Chitinophagaceae bacterium]